MLGDYYPDLRDERAETIGAFGHNRYSTNTWPSFKRVQPFSVLGHNGEINTIEQLRQEAKMLGVPIEPGSSDSQDLNRTIDTLVSRVGLSLAEAMEMVVPPIVDEIRTLPAGAAPLLHVPAPDDGPVRAGPGRADRPPHRRVRVLRRRPRPAAAVAGRDRGRLRLQLRAGRRLGRRRWSPSRSRSPPARRRWSSIDRERQALDPALPRRDAAASSATAGSPAAGDEDAAAYDRALDPGGPLEGGEVPGYSDAGPEEPVKVSDRILAGFGWQRDDVKLVQQMASNGAEPVGSLGYDGPLAALSPERQNLADYFKETVAVVTNPAIDREREMEHFSTRAVFGRRPSFDDRRRGQRHGRDRLPGDPRRPPRPGAALRHAPTAGSPASTAPTCSRTSGRSSAAAPTRSTSRCSSRETTQGAIERIKQEAVKKVRDGAELLILTDRTVHDGERRYLDPHLATSAVDQALKQFKVEPGEVNLRRRCGIVLRSAAIRNVHDVMLALGLGANGVCPYTMVEVICVEDYETDVSNLCAALTKGIEKVISTIGIHEVRGYARQFSSIGIKPELAEIFQTEAFAASRARAAPASPTSTTTPTSAPGSSPATRTRNRRRRSASTRRSTRRRSRPPTAPAATRNTRRRSATSSARTRSRCAT